MTEPADEIRADCVETLAAWLPPISTSLPGWALDLVERDQPSGRLTYALKPYAPTIRDRAPRRFRVRITVEEITP